MKKSRNFQGSTTMDSRIKAVTFDEVNHKYYYNSAELFGVTSAIGKLMGKSFPDTDTVKLATIYGTDVHKEVENYFNSNGKLTTEGAKWVVEEINNFENRLIHNHVESVECEVMVSNFEKTASKIDVVMHTVDGAYIFDIKTTSKFDRAYCSLQLSCYKRMYEANYGEKVLGMFVLGTKSRRTFRIIEQEDAKVQKILDMNKGV